LALAYQFSGADSSGKKGKKASEKRENGKYENRNEPGFSLALANHLVYNTLYEAGQRARSENHSLEAP
jgi:hypothetical protein